MSNHILFEKYDGSLRELFKPENKYTFLVGAGISMDAPTNMPSAKQIVWNLLQIFAPPDEINTLFSLDLLRYELIVEKIQNIFDQELKFLDYLELVDMPNLIHVFLAYAIIRGHYVVTTNFDYLIEQALLKILKVDFHENIIPVITKNDFLRYQNPGELIKKGKFPIYKIHGSKRNIITNTNTQDSLITTISSLGKDREEGETFAIEPFKKIAFMQVMNERSLVVMGYSGSDDFDIGPTLKEIPDLSKLIWVEHSNEPTLDVSKLRKLPSFDLNGLSSIDKLLVEIRKKHGFDIIKVKVNTYAFLKEILWSLILPYDILDDILNQVIKDEKVKKIPNFGEWVKLKYDNVPLTEKIRFAANLYYDLKQIDATERIAKLGIEIAESEGNISSKSLFLNFQGMISQIKGNYNSALTYYEEALQIDRGLRDINGIAADLDNIGTVLLTLGQYDDSLENFQESLAISEEQDDISGEITSLNNIGRIHEIRQNFEESLGSYTKALKLTEKIGDLGRKSALLNNIGRIYGQQGDFASAKERYEEALHIVEELGDLYGIIILLNNIGMIYHYQNDLDESVGYLNKAIEAARQLGDLSRVAGSLNNIGSTHLARNELDLALEKYEEALAIEEELGDPLMKVIYLNNIGMIHASKGNNATAVKHYEDALEITELIGDLSKSALILTKIGGVLGASGKINQALEKYQGALNLYEKIDDLPNKAATLSNIARIHFHLEDYDNAQDFFELTLQLDKELGDKMGVASDLMSLANILGIKGDFNNAIKLYEESRDILFELDQEEAVNNVNKIIRDLKNKISN